jgi:CheY-like chemotaxis protein
VCALFYSGNYDRNVPLISTGNKAGEKRVKITIPQGCGNKHDNDKKIQGQQQAPPARPEAEPIEPQLVAGEQVLCERDSTKGFFRKNSKILIVDDEPDIIYWLENVLEDNGFVVDSYTNPTLALSNFKPGLYNLLVLDIKMPEMDGFELYQKMRGIDSNVGVCFLTASKLFYEEHRRLDAYPTLDKEKCFIQKPCGNEELIRKLNQTLYPH